MLRSVQIAGFRGFRQFELHDAIKQRILRADSPHAGPFVRRFCRLFEGSP